jgi:hypothetical protein
MMYYAQGFEHPKATNTKNVSNKGYVKLLVAGGEV